jgi:hypothetical protein
LTAGQHFRFSLLKNLLTAEKPMAHRARGSCTTARYCQVIALADLLTG